MTPEEITAGTAHLSAIDPALAAIILRVGPCALVPDTDPFKALARAIIGQQVSIHAAAAIWNRFESLCGPDNGVTPASVTAVAVEDLRAAGLSGAKARYVHDLGAKFLDGTIESRRLDSMADEEIITHLTQVKGVATFPQHAESETTLIEAADAALYYAKRSGKNRVRSADSLPFLTAETGT